MLNEFLSGVTRVIEATDFEQDCLWHRYAERENVDWHQILNGHGKSVGVLDGRSVFISLRAAVINGKKFLFFHPTSVVVDWRMINAWIDSVLPDALRFDADNFGSALHD